MSIESGQNLNVQVVEVSPAQGRPQAQKFSQEGPAFSPSYARGLPHVDSIEQLRANVRQLERLHGQLNFMLREVRSLAKKA